MRREPDEIVQEFSARFIKVYNSIPTEVKPLLRVARVRYVNSFESDFAFLLREITSTSLDDMMNDAIEFEVNLLSSINIKYNYDKDMKKVQYKAQPSTSQSSEERFELNMKTMEKIMERMSLENKPNTR